MSSSWMRTAQAAEKLNVSPATVRRLVRADVLPHRWVGSQLRFVPEELDAWTGTGRSRPAAAVPDWKAGLAALDPYAA